MTAKPEPDAMPDAVAASDPARILAERLRIVLALTEANAAHRLAQARAGGAQLEVMTLERRAEEAQGGPPRPETLEELDAVRSRDAAAREAMTATEARIVALEAEMDALDRALAGANG